jgi:hypothetical protein
MPSQCQGWSSLINSCSVCTQAYTQTSSKRVETWNKAPGLYKQRAAG